MNTKLFLIAAAMAAMATAPALAGSVTVLIKKENGTRTETTVTPGPKLPDTVVPGAKLPDTVIPGTPGTAKDYANRVNDKCLTGTLLGPKGKKVPAINVDDNCNPFPLLTIEVGGTLPVVIDNGYGPDTIIDNGYGPDVVTTTTIPTCKRTYKTISTSYPYVSTSTTVTDGAC